MPRFNDYSLSSYGNMVVDARRTLPYVQALTRAITPGSVVLDIGTGTGLFAFLAARLGARKVYAIEPDDAIEVARLCAQDNPNAERIEWIQGLSTELELPERADVVIADLHGTMPFFKKNIESMRDARLRHLKRGGLLLPCRDALYVAPANAAEEYRTVSHPWAQNDYGVDFSAGRRWVANSWWKVTGDAVPEEALLGKPALWGTIDYMTVNASTLQGSADWIAGSAGPMHGYYVWFESDLGGDLRISNTPLLPGIAYGRAFFPLEHPVQLAAGDRIQVRLAVNHFENDHIYRWDTLVVGSNGEDKARFRQSTFNSRPVVQRASQASESHVPLLSESGEVDLAILQGMAASMPLGSIADALSQRFPSKYPSKAEALSKVCRVSGAYDRSRQAAPGLVPLSRGA